MAGVLALDDFVIPANRFHEAQIASFQIISLERTIPEKAVMCGSEASPRDEARSMGFNPTHLEFVRRIMC